MFHERPDKCAEGGDQLPLLTDFLSASMPMPMMDIRVMRVAVHQWRVLVEMGMRRVPVPREVVFVPMVFVVYVGMVVRERHMCVLMGVTLGEVQPHAGRHESGRAPE